MGDNSRFRLTNWMASTLRAMGALCYGEMGRVVNVQRQTNLAELLRHPVILELDSLLYWSPWS